MTIPVGYAQVNLFFDGTSAPEGAQVTLGLDIGSYSGTADELAEAVGDEWVAHLMGALASTLHLNGVAAKFGPDATGPTGYVPFDVAGGSAGVGAPPNLAYLIHKRTALGGRAGRGRMYIPGVTESNVDPSGNLEGTTAADLTGLMETFRSVLDLAGVPPVILHQPGSPLVTPTPITEFAAASRAATQRQRMRR
jgi:hypothetical protein